MCSSSGDKSSAANLETCLDLLDQMIEAGERIVRRGQAILSPEAFTQSDAGIDAMDGIVMMIIVLGETVKKLEKVAPSGLLLGHPEIDWKGVKGMRDILSHEYFGVNPTVVFDVTRNKVPTLLSTVRALKADIKEER